MTWRAVLMTACLLLPAACRRDHYGMVNIEQKNLRILREMRYATINNFTHKVLYDRAECWLNAVAAARLDAVQKDLEQQGYGLKVWDCYRPLSVQKKFWALVPDERYVANPAKGSRHNRGAAVDLTLVRADGSEVPMPTPHDDFTERAHRNYMDLPDDVKANRALLEKVMVKHGWSPLPTEWWHFDSEGWESYPVMDIDFDAL